MSFRNVDSIVTAKTYTDGLNKKWPARAAMMTTIANRIREQHADKQVENPVVLELCCGGGVLAQYLLATFPQITYTGIDFSPHLLDLARQTTSSYQDRVTFLEADLNRDWWLNQVSTYSQPTFDAIVSMQAIHDLGDESKVSRIYSKAYMLLKQWGVFINADLIVEPGDELPNNPGRLTILRHLKLLGDWGYWDKQCILEDGGFGCIVGTKFVAKG
ncbi:MAG: class I SAM-dependent methyltransferase [Chloroflexota bacterium]